MFADNIAILSESPKGVQNSWIALDAYCNKYKLSVNHSITKVIIFNCNKISKFKFIYI